MADEFSKRSEPRLEVRQYYSHELDKTSIGISLPYKTSFKRWDEWSAIKGMDKVYEEVLISSAHAEETHETWYISECEIPIEDFLEVENIAAGETISVDDAINSFPDTEIQKVRFQSEIDEYTAKQPTGLQILLLNVRLTIRQTLPNATEKISWQMPTFWQGRNLIHFAAQKTT